MRRSVLVLFMASAPLAPVLTALAADRPKVMVIFPPPPDAGMADAAPDVSTFAPSTTLPDPPALVARQQWVFGLRWSRGDVYLLGVDRLDAGIARATPRAIGRFAIELWEGKTLVERVRFDFPGLGAPDTDGGHLAPPSFERKLTTRIGVIFPATTRGTRAELVDRATAERWMLPWPPNTNHDGGD